MATLADMLADRFPPMAAFSAEWAPIYLEPLPGSGERLTVAIATRAADGTYQVARTLDDKRAHCMYGPHAPSLIGFVTLIEDSLRMHLASGETLHTWHPPLRDTVMLGPISDGYGDRLEDIVHAGTLLAASLAAWRPAEVVEVASEDSPPDGDDWAVQIREGTLARRAGFAPRFMQKVRLRHGAPATRIDYLGNRLAAQFGRLLPGRGLTNSRNRAKAYITDLQMLRDQDKAIAPRPFYELMLWLPPADAPSYTAMQREEAQGAFAELEAFGDTHELRVESLRDSDAAVQRILHAEEAA